jgi:hypothetical protein
LKVSGLPLSSATDTGKHRPGKQIVFGSRTFDAVEELIEAISSSSLRFGALSISHTKINKDDSSMES